VQSRLCLTPGNAPCRWRRDACITTLATAVRAPGPRPRRGPAVNTIGTQSIACCWLPP
jgi:hypothetical protein